MTTGNVFVPGVSGLQFNAYITEAERPAFVKSIRDMGRDFTNFTMLDRDADNNLFPTPPNAAPYYCVIVHSAPLTDFLAILGYNVASSPYEVDEVFKSKTQGVDTCTRTFMLVENQRGFIYYSPIYTHKNRTFVGLASGVFHVKPLFDEVKEESVALFAFDRNLTKTDTDYFIYSSLHDGQINGYSKNVSNVTAQEIIRKAPYLLWDTVRVADRIWDVAYVPSSGFLYDFDGWEKWIALFGSLITAVFIVLLSTIFIKRIEHGQVLHQLSKERVLMLQESEIKLTKYLDLIANKERESRLILDAIPDYIIIVDGQGQIKLANQTFDKVIKVKKEQGIMVSTLLPKLAPDFFLEGYTDQLETEFKKLTGSVIPVIVSVRVLDSGSFMIIVRSVAEKKTLEEQLKRRESQVRRMQEIRAFDDRMMSEEFRTQFKDFCKREKNDENIDFIAAVNEYKSQSAKERIEMQHEILQTFISEGSSRELNIDKELRKEIEKRVGESVGDVSVFDKVVETIKTTIILDILPRYSSHRRKSVVTK
jgi:PAS domain-containing protein